MNHRLKKLLQTLLFLSTGAIILYIVYFKYNQAYVEDCALKGIAAEDCNLLTKVYQDFLRSDFKILILVLLLYIISNISRALRWNQLLKTFGVKPKFYNLFLTIMLGYFANLGLPRIGEVIRAATLARYENMKVDRVMGTVILDRIMDMVLMVIFAVVAFIASSAHLVSFLKENGDVSTKLYGFIQNPVIISGLILITVLIIIFFRSGKLKNSSFGIKVRGFLTGIADGLRSISELDRPWIFVFHSFFIWLMYFLMLYIGFFAFEPTSQIGILPGLVVFVLGGIGFVIPSPGGMGTYHFLITSGLVMYGINSADGFSFANIMFFTIQIFANIFIGIIALVLLPSLNSGRNNLEQA